MDFKYLPTVQFGDTPTLIDALADLIKQGIKTASCARFDKDSETPKVGQRMVVLNSKKIRICIIEITKTEIMPFDQISEKFAFLEGEGDRTLSFWRKEHQRFFASHNKFSPDMLLLCEYFKVIHLF